MPTAQKSAKPTTQKKTASKKPPMKIRVGGVVYEKLPRKIRVDGKLYEMVEPKTTQKTAAKKPEAKKPEAKKQEVKGKK